MNAKACGLSTVLLALLITKPVGACEQANPVVAGASLDVQVTRVDGLYRYSYSLANPVTSTGCLYGLLVDVAVDPATPGTITVGPKMRVDPSRQGKAAAPGKYEALIADGCAGGVGGIGMFSWSCADTLTATSPADVRWLEGLVVRPGERLENVVTVESSLGPGPRRGILKVEWDPDASGTRFNMSAPPDAEIQTIGPADPLTLVLYDGGGQKPVDVNKFLTYTNPIEHRTRLPPGTRRFAVSIRYGDTIQPATFKASLNGTDITFSFSPTPGGIDVVTVSLQPGSNTLVFSTDGKTAAGRSATDTDRLVLLAE